MSNDRILIAHIGEDAVGVFFDVRCHDTWVHVGDRIAHADRDDAREFEVFRIEPYFGVPAEFLDPGVTGRIWVRPSGAARGIAVPSFMRVSRAHGDGQRP